METPSPDLSATGLREVSLRLQQLEERLERLEAEVEIIKTQNRMVIQNTHLSFRNAAYLRGGLGLLLPRDSTFSFHTDTGIGASLGLGQYLGRNHVFELTLYWDAHLAAALQYRLEFHTSGSGLTWGPILGYRTRVIDLKPFDRFLDQPSAVRKSFYFFGGALAFPVSGGSLFGVQVLYLRNVQQILSLDVHVNFFL